MGQKRSPDSNIHANVGFLVIPDISTFTNPLDCGECLGITINTKFGRVKVGKLDALIRRATAMIKRTGMHVIKSFESRV